MLPGVTPPITRISSPQLTFLGTTSNATTTAVVSMVTVTAARPGLMVVCAAGRSSATRNVSDVSIGGSTGKVHFANTATTNPGAVASRLVSSGSNAISITYTSTTASANQGVGVWLITDYQSTVSIGSSIATAATPTAGMKVQFNASRNGIATFCAARGSTVEQTWAGVPSAATTRGGSTSGTWRIECADQLTTISAETSVSNTVGAGANGCLAGGAWR